MNGINIFESRKGMLKFARISNSLSGSARAVFTSAVKDLFDRKSVSENGQYDSFKITEKDLDALVPVRITRDEYDNHDCHSSEDDGCSVCVEWE